MIQERKSLGRVKQELEETKGDEMAQQAGGGDYSPTNRVRMNGVTGISKNNQIEISLKRTALLVFVR